MNHLIEFPTLVKKENNRIWKIFVRLIKKESRQNFQTIDWNLMLETQISIKEEYSDRLPDDIIAQFWVETGKVNGKLSRSIPTYPEEKNIGKKNFRNRFSQAIFLCQSKWNQKKKEGFIEIGNDIVSDYKIFPMLANPWEKQKTIKYPVAIQYKLDGIRCICSRNPEGKLIMYSRTKKDFPENKMNNRIRQVVDKVLPPNTYFDGELYNHEVKLQTLNHYVRSSEDNEGGLYYFIYDIVSLTPQNFSERLKQLMQIRVNDPVHILDTKIVYSREEMDVEYKKSIEEGYEGIMIRDLNGYYAGNTNSTTGTRSKFLLKRKEVYTNEFLIIEYTHGTNGKDLEAIVWICETDQGKKFKVIPNLTYEERYNILNECKTGFFEKKYKHRLLVVEYRSLSSDQVPQHGKGIYIRDIE